MIGVLIVSHGMFAESLLSSGDVILGNHNNCFSVCLTDEGIFSFSKAVESKLDFMFQNYDQVLVLSDLKGGTPYNQALKYKLEKNKEKMVIATGFNMPMFAELVVLLPDATNIFDLANKVIEVAKESIEIDNLENEVDDDIFN